MFNTIYYMIIIIIYSRENNTGKWKFSTVTDELNSQSNYPIVHAIFLKSSCSKNKILHQVFPTN